MLLGSLFSRTKDILEDNIKLVFTFSLFFSFLVVSAYLVSDIYNGGNGWKQGDWLINNHSEFVRRGMLGSVFLWISDFTSINPIYIVSAVQFSIICIIYHCFWRVGLRLRNNEIALFLIVSPLFLFFWSNDPQGSMRKEMLAYLSFVPFILLAQNRSKSLVRYVIVSQLLYSIAVFGHEANVFFVPFFAAFIYMFTGSLSLKFFQLFIPYLVFSILGFLYFVFNSSVNDFMTICQPILSRGVEDSICNGALKWLAKGSSDAFSAATKMVGRYAVSKFFFAYFLLFVFYVHILSKFIGYSRSILVFSFSMLPFLPLYFVAIDWGRWMNFHIFSLTVLCLLYFTLKDFKVELNKYERTIMIFFCFSWGVSHVGGYFGIEHGFAYRFMMMGSSFLNFIN